MCASPFSCLLLSAMQLWTPESRHLYLERPAVTAARYEALADAMAAGVQEAGGSVLEGLELASIAGFESEYRADIADCRKSGKSWTVFQVSTHRNYACASFRQGVRVALFRLRESRAMCARFAEQEQLSYYATGKCQTSWFSRSRVERARAWLPACAEMVPGLRCE